MSYATTQDFIARYPNRDLIQLTQEDTSQVTVNSATVQTFLDDASNEIDAYLEARFALPLSYPPAILVRLCCEIAMYHLNALRPIHDLQDAKDKYEKAIAFLEEVSHGNLTLGLNTATGQEPADTSIPAVLVQTAGGTGVPSRVFSRVTLNVY